MWKIIIGLFIVASVVVFFATREDDKSTYRVKSRYAAHSPSISDKHRSLADKLCNTVAPKVRGRTFTKATIDKMVDYDPLFDQVMYYNFCQMLNGDNMESDKLLTRSMTSVLR